MPVDMGDSGYEHECSRAELLGVTPPSYEEYLRKIAAEGPDDGLEGASKETGDSEEVKDGGDKPNSAGKLDEINNIIQSTQQKLNRFKVSYGSLTSALKSKLGKSLDLSFSQSDYDGSSRTNDEPEPSSSANTDKNGQSVIGTESIVDDKDKQMIPNRTAQNGQSDDARHGGIPEDLEYKEIELNETEEQKVKSTETKKFLNFGFLNLGGGK